MIKLLSNYWIPITYWLFWQQLRGMTATEWSIYDICDWQIKGQWQTDKGRQWQMTEWDRVLTIDIDKNTLTWITSIDVLDFRFHLKQKPLGDWLEELGWCNFIDRHGNSFHSESRIIFECTHAARTRYAHQVTAATLHILMTKAYEKHLIEKKTISDFKMWRKDKESQYPQFYFWSETLKLQLLEIYFIRSIRSGDFNLYKVAISLLMPWFFAFNHTHYSRWLSVHLCVCFNYKKPIQRFSVISMKVIL